MASAGGTTLSATVDKRGLQVVESGGIASGIVVYARGTQLVSAGGTAVAETISGGSGFELSGEPMIEMSGHVGAELACVVAGAVDQSGFSPAEELQAHHVQAGRTDHATIVADRAFAIEHRHFDPFDLRRRRAVRRRHFAVEVIVFAQAAMKSMTSGNVR